MVFEAVGDSESIIFFVAAGLAAYSAFMFWYKGNAMCGAALGMACNGTFSFWGPLCCWLILGIAFGIAGWTMAPIAWLAAIIMVCGIFIIAMNPMDLFKKGNK
jgi:drug/metabolite transporter (DMT)-like permease